MKLKQSKRVGHKRMLAGTSINITPKRMAILMFSGFLMGVFMVSMGWAQTAPHKKNISKHQNAPKHHKVVLHKSPKKGAGIAAHRRSKVRLAQHPQKRKASVLFVARPKIHAVAKNHAYPKPQAYPKMAVRPFSHPDGYYSFNYPATWQANSKKDAMLVNKIEPNGDRVVFGIVKRSDDEPNEEAVMKEFEAQDKPLDLTQMPARVAGMQATKVIGTSKLDANNKMVEYYVQNPGGHQFYILMMAPRDSWNRYNVAFTKMLGSISFN